MAFCFHISFAISRIHRKMKCRWFLPRQGCLRWPGRVLSARAAAKPQVETDCGRLGCTRDTTQTGSRDAYFDERADRGG